MVQLIAQLSDVHLGGRTAGSGERFSQAIDEINSMTRPPQLVVMTGDITEDGTDEQWAEFEERVAALSVPWEVIAGNHDRAVDNLRGHRTTTTGTLRLILLDTSSDEFTADDADWLDAELGSDDSRTVVAIHQPPFETGLWWMDAVGLAGGDRFEAVIRRHPHVELVMCGHVHRPITTNWGGCAVFVCPSTESAAAIDFDPKHEPATTAEAPTIAMHAFTETSVISHILPIGPAADRSMISQTSPDFVEWVREKNQTRPTDFS